MSDRTQLQSQTLKKLNSSFKTIVFQLSKNELELNNKINELKDYAHTIAHDLRSPLATAFSFQSFINQQLHEGKIELDSHIEYAGIIEKNLQSAMTLIDEMLRYAESGGKVDLEKSFSIHEVISLALSNIGDDIEKSKADVSVNTAHYTLKGSQSLLASALTNLISNSIKYSYNSSTPKIEIIGGVNEEQRPYLTIRDNGIGIPPEKHEEIFHDFVRLDRDTNAGNGLGLHTVKKILRGHNAEVKVDSEVGEGSSFTILFESQTLE